MKNFKLNEDNSFSFKIKDYEFTGFRFMTEVVGGACQNVDLSWKLVDLKEDAKTVKGEFVHPFLAGVKTVFKAEKQKNGIVIQRSIKNNTANDIYLSNWSDMTGGVFEVGSDAEIYSTENCCASFLNICWGGDDNIPDERPKEFGTFVNGKRYNEPLLGKILNFGTTENQPYPAQVLVDPEKGSSLVLGLLSNKVSDMAVAYSGKKKNAEIQSISIDTSRYFRGQNSLLLKAGERADGEKIYCGIADTLNITDAVDDYNKLLKKELVVRTDKDRMAVFKNGRVWGSWNLGLYRDISHEMIVEQARIISKERKDLDWIQVDDGYTVAPKPGLFILEGPGIDKEKFPKGLKAFAKDIKELGLKPALWVGLIINPEVEIPDFAKDWLLQKKDGSYLMLPDGNKFLDFSLKEVRDYFEKIVKTVTKKWGFEGFKFDFWSDHFHCTEAAYRNPEFTGAMLRDWFWKTLRKYVGDEGFLLTCCCVGSGNPFIGQYADSYRCGIDIGHGEDWHGQVSTAFWYAAQAKFKTSQFIIPNIDSMGDFTTIINENMHRCWTSFTALTGAHVEYGGLLHKESKDYGPKTVEAFNWVPLGKMPEPVDFPVPLQGNMAPMLWLNSSKNGKVIYLAVCNWNSEKESKSFTLKADDLGVSSFKGLSCQEFWSGQDVSFSKDELKVPVIPACDAMVFVIS